MSSFLRTLLPIGTLCILAAALDSAAEEGPAVTDPEQGGREYQIQGEYVGDASDQRWGCQVIALGENKFEAVGLSGGLPGDGWNRGNDVLKIPGELHGEQAHFSTDQFRLTIAGEKLTVFDTSGQELGLLKKVSRKSPTLGKKPPSDATVLFDGTSTAAWNQGEILEIGGEKLLASSGCETKEKFGDHFLHLEFRTPFQSAARGQARGNSGVYVQSRYEVQVLDSFGLEGLDNECGGIYSIQRPAVNMCYPPLSWQTYDIEFRAAGYDGSGNKIKNARMTVEHNGVVIHRDLELKAGTPGRHPEGREPQPLFLQHHGNPVAYRNIWVISLE